MIDSNPNVTISNVSGEAPSTQRITPRSMANPMRNEIAIDAEEGDDPRRAPVLDLPGDERGQHRQLALGEVGDVGRPVHEHEAEREGGVDRAVGQAVEQRLDELRDIHVTPPGTRA